MTAPISLILMSRVANSEYDTYDTHNFEAANEFVLAVKCEMSGVKRQTHLSNAQTTK
jgi:hypothetical protein